MPRSNPLLLLIHILFLALRKKPPSQFRAAKQAEKKGAEKKKQTKKS
jgi:hypothetical protein